MSEDHKGAGRVCVAGRCPARPQLEPRVNHAVLKKLIEPELDLHAVKSRTPCGGWLLAGASSSGQQQDREAMQTIERTGPGLLTRHLIRAMLDVSQACSHLTPSHIPWSKPPTT